MRSSPSSSSSIDATDDDDDDDDGGLSSAGASAIGNIKSGPAVLTGDRPPGDV
jgi:hypothetical protein